MFNGPYATDPTPYDEPLLRWFANGERGWSSNFMAEWLTRIPCTGPWGNHNDHPLDPDDLRRCRLLLAMCPRMEPVFSHMRTASPKWARLVGHWVPLCGLMDAEVPQWQARKGTAYATYRYMRMILDGTPRKHN